MGIKIESHGASKRKRKPEPQKYDWHKLDVFINVGKIALPLSIFFISAVKTININSRTEALNKYATNMELEIKDMEREMANSTVKYEQLSGRSVLAQIKRFNLPLRFAQPGQIKVLDQGGAQGQEAVGRKNIKKVLMTSR